MASFHQRHTTHSTEDALGRALHEVSIPDGLEQRILARLQHGGVDVRDQGWTRRGWLTTALAAGCGGLVAGGGSYAWFRRPLSVEDVQQAITESLALRDWILPWQEIPSDRRLDGIPFPRELRTVHGWQYRSLSIGGEAVACDVSIPGCVAVLFAMKTWRDVTQFAPAPPATPLGQSGLPWKSLAIWQHQRRYLYALAIQGSRREYQRLISTKTTAPLA